MHLQEVISSELSLISVSSLNICLSQGMNLRLYLSAVQELIEISDNLVNRTWSSEAHGGTLLAQRSKFSSGQIQRFTRLRTKGLCKDWKLLPGRKIMYAYADTKIDQLLLVLAI